MVNVRRSDSGSILGAFWMVTDSVTEKTVLNEQGFRRMVCLERKRSERSGKPFVLMLLDLGAGFRSEKSAKALELILTALSRSTRETDSLGWYQEGSVVGIAFPEIGAENRRATLTRLIVRISEVLRSNLTSEQFDQIIISFHVFPDDWDQSDGPSSGNPVLYPDLKAHDDAQTFSRAIKRAVDICSSLAALVFLSPFFLTIAIAIKLTSKGPVFFRQHRTGQFNVPFSLLKFRSMHANSSNTAHKEYVRKLIAGVADKHPSNGDDGRGVYKLTRDSRITRVGAFLRRTSLDELPQLINVLKGEMSLVGPRPPIDYEVEKYEPWHRLRLMEAKPGITGLWQVCGRNRIAFDDMVRLDLLYARSWSPWLDIKILLRTPRAVIEGAH
jgi:lipopolysaccharide/colanic/teichoic acid biosynthesis glycosyltransferase